MSLPSETLLGQENFNSMGRNPQKTGPTDKMCKSREIRSIPGAQYSILKNNDRSRNGQNSTIGGRICPEHHFVDVKKYIYESG